MSIQVGDLVTVKNNKIQITQINMFSLTEPPFSPIEITSRKGVIFEVLEVYHDTKSVRILPLNFGVTAEFIIIAEIDNIHKCGRAVEYLYGKKKT